MAHVQTTEASQLDEPPPDELPPDEPPPDELPADVQVRGSVFDEHVKFAQLEPFPRYFPLHPEELLLGLQRSRFSFVSKYAQAPPLELLLEPPPPELLPPPYRESVGFPEP